MPKAEKYSDDDIAALKQLNDYKWSEKFTCKRCMHKEYKKGRTPFSRRCKNRDCDFDESLLKYTALEGLRFPPSKAYGILNDLLEASNPNDDDKIIPIERNRKKKINELDIEGIEDRYNEGECISLNQLFERYKKGDISKEIMEKLCMQCVKDRSITIAKLAEKYQLQESTISKFIDKIAYRVEYDDCYHDMTHLEVILDYIHGWGLGMLLGFVMFPTDDAYYRNERKLGDKWYKMQGPFEYKIGGRWYLSINTFWRKNEKGESIQYYNKPGELDCIVGAGDNVFDIIDICNR